MALATFAALMLAAVLATCGCAEQSPRPAALTLAAPAPAPPVAVSPRCKLLGFQRAIGLAQPNGLGSVVLREVRDWTYLCPLDAAPNTGPRR
jgi:hypothetical protein